MAAEEAATLEIVSERLRKPAQHTEQSRIEEVAMALAGVGSVVAIWGTLNGTPDMVDDLIQKDKVKARRAILAASGATLASVLALGLAYGRRSLVPAGMTLLMGAALFTGYDSLQAFDKPPQEDA